MKKRSSILFYFDNFHLVSSLPDEQLGLLFRALMEFGEREANGEPVSVANFSLRYPAMGELTRGFFAFMADTVRRDAATYREKCANYRAAAEKRAAEKTAPRESRPFSPGSFSPGGCSSRAAAQAQQLDSAWDYVT